MSSIYHILDKMPAIYYEDMQQEYEELAQELVKSGKLRIDTDYNCNFARFTNPRLNLNSMVSKEELTDPSLVPHTKKYFKTLYSKHLKGELLDKKITTILSELKKQINKLQPVNPEVTVKLARLLVQSAHPIVIKWLLHDKVEVFITYSHNIGDMMSMHDWQHSGSNSGMQSTDGKNVAIFVSGGGNPFAENSKDYPMQGDGWAAIARLQIIAAQELGHFADIKRNEKGQQITRHSANFAGTKATEHVKLARKNDIENCDKLLATLLLGGMDKLLSQEEQLRFYHKNKIKGLRVIWCKLLSIIYKYKLLNYANKHKLLFIRRFAQERYMSLMIKAMIADMKFNLSPVADVYKRSDKEAEEAIKCIEALARVPQQVMKWGYLTTMATMKNLYHVYYSEVIPSLIKSYTAMTGHKYRRNYHPASKPLKDFFQKFNIFKKHHSAPVPVRELP